MTSSDRLMAIHLPLHEVEEIRLDDEVIRQTVDDSEGLKIYFRNSLDQSSHDDEGLSSISVISSLVWVDEDLVRRDMKNKKSSNHQKKKKKSQA